MVVTGALAAVAATALPRFRAGLVVYVGLVGITRIMFGAHFPLDVLVGTVVGWQTGLFCVGVVASSGLLPSAILGRRTVLRPPPCAPHEQSA